MADSPGPVYEVNLRVDREIAEAFDDWLAAHVSEMLELPGFVRARTFATDDGDRSHLGRIVQYFLDSEAALQTYLDGPADAMRHSAVERFGNRFTATRRVLRPTDAAETPAPASCLNCGAPLAGQYCSHCGQRARARLISIRELVSDAFGDLFELDSRLWRTLLPLAFRPGRLTREYLLGRRARFMPPFRTYLFMSVIFFLVAFFNPRQQFGLLFEPAAPVDANPGEARKSAGEIRKEVAAELAAEGVSIPEFTAGTAPEPAAHPAPSDAPDKDAARPGKTDNETHFAGCYFGDLTDASFPAWWPDGLTVARMQETCERINADSGGFFSKWLNNVPASLFILLPLMAVVLKLLYPLSKRYYAEHLLFVVHFHAFVFMALTVEILFSRLAKLASLPDAASDLAGVAVALYILVYLYKALRRVYEQGRAITLLKYFFLALSYVIGLTLMLIFVALYTVVSI